MSSPSGIPEGEENKKRKRQTSEVIMTENFWKINDRY